MSQDFIVAAKQHFKDVQILDTNRSVIFIKKGKEFGQYVIKGPDYPPTADRYAPIFKSIEEGFKQDIQKTHN